MLPGEAKILLKALLLEDGNNFKKDDKSALAQYLRSACDFIECGFIMMFYVFCRGRSCAVEHQYDARYIGSSVE